MFVLTVDQVGSRRAPDHVAAATERIRDRYAEQIALGPDRTAGDEFQVCTSDARTALAIVLDLLRDGDWSVGVGVGDVERPLPGTTREARGPAFTAARDAVDRAKRSSHRFALTSTERDAADVEAMIALLLELRARRTPEGWEIADRLDGGATQAEAAESLGITPQAVSLRARSAGLRVDRAARPALERLLAALDAADV